jgi:prepilin-type processing-associated H-X9-DG protein
MLTALNDLSWNANAPYRMGVANPPRHEGNNFGFADGHVKMMKFIPSQK